MQYCTSSQIFSNLGIQETARWQFCSTTHVPSLMAFSIIRVCYRTLKCSP